MISAETFADCTGLTRIVIPDSVTEIGDFAFSGCTNLASIKIPNSVKKIGFSAFAGCHSLDYFDMPYSIETPRYHLPHVGALAAGTHQGLRGPYQGVQVVGHDDMVLHVDHGVACVDGGEQFVFHHLPHGRELDTRRFRAADGSHRVARHGTQDATPPLCHMQCDVVGAGAAVVVGRGAASHAMVGRVGH